MTQSFPRKFLLRRPAPCNMCKDQGMYVPDNLLELTSTNCRFEVLAKLNGSEPAWKLATVAMRSGPHTSGQ